MFAWGENDSGQLGVADTAPRLTPHKVLSSSSFVSVACGSRTTLGVTKSGNILGWGSAVAKVLGEDIEDEAVTVPRAIEGVERMVCVATRGAHAVALDENGDVYTWGRGEQDYHNVTRPTKLPFRGVFVRLIGAGRMHSVAVDDAGTLYTWGSSDEGQTGTGKSDFVPVPTAVTSLRHPVLKLSCGSRHTLVVVDGKDGVGGGIYGFGGNSFAQLGLGDREPRFIPTRVDVLLNTVKDAGDEAAGIKQANQLNVACGYRHSFVYTDKIMFGFGWNSNHQVAPSSDGVITRPVRIKLGPNLFQEEVLIKQVAGGGRHTMVMVRDRHDSSSYKLVAFGRSLSGELGIPRYVEHSKPDPVLVLTISDPNADETPNVACGWEHTVVTAAGGRVDAPSFSHSWFSSIKGDLDAALAQFVNCIVLLRLVPTQVRLGAGITIALSNFVFALWAWYVGATALPHGLNTIALFAIQMGAYSVMLEKYPDQPDKALGACFFCTITLGLAQAVSAFAVAPLLKRYVPRSALAASVAGVALAFISTRFAGEIFESPKAGMASFMILLIGLAARQRMPMGIPVAFVALLVGWLVSDSSEQLIAININQSPPSINIVSVLTDTEYYPFILTVVFPLLIVNMVNDLACIDQARASGDLFQGSTGLALDAVVTLFGALLFGSPYPTCIYVGHSSYKAMGATALYSLINAFMVFGIIHRFPMIFVNVVESIPQVATVGILLWIGSMVTAEAFKTKRHGVAVVLALVPALAAWRTSQVQGQERDVGLEILGGGYMMVSLIIGAVVAHIIDRRFFEASVWLLVGAVLSWLGWIHGTQSSKVAEGYFVSAIVTGIWAFGQWMGGESEGDMQDGDIPGHEQSSGGPLSRVSSILNVARMAPSPMLTGQREGLAIGAPVGAKYGSTTAV